MKSNSVGPISFSWRSTLGFDLLSKEISFENQTYTIPRKILYLSGQILDMRIKEWSRCSTLKVTQVYWRHVIAASGAWVESTSFFSCQKIKSKLLCMGRVLEKRTSYICCCGVDLQWHLSGIPSTSALQNQIARYIKIGTVYFYLGK